MASLPRAGKHRPWSPAGRLRQGGPSPSPRGASMARPSTVRTVLALLRAGNLRARLRVTRDGQAAVRLNTGAAALRTGVLDVLAGGPAATSELARRLGTPEEDLLAAFLRVLAAGGLVRDDRG